MEEIWEDESEATAGPRISLAQLRRLTQLESMDLDELLATWDEFAAEDGSISRADFNDCFAHILGTKGYVGDVAAVLAGLWDVFDHDSNGVIDYNELMAALSVLCGGDREDKVAAVFCLYDKNNDGVISKEEMGQYLASVFKAMYKLGPRRAGPAPSEPRRAGGCNCAASLRPGRP